MIVHGLDDVRSSEVAGPVQKCQHHFLVAGTIFDLRREEIDEELPWPESDTLALEILADLVNIGDRRPAVILRSIPRDWICVRSPVERDRRSRRGVTRHTALSEGLTGTE